MNEGATRPSGRLGFTASISICLGAKRTLQLGNSARIQGLDALPVGGGLCLAESSHASGGFGVPEVTVIDRNLVFCFSCPACGELVPLPAQSTLGAIAAFQFNCAYMWPIRFLCQRFFVVREVNSSTIHLATEKMIRPMARPRSLWQIDCECCLESCGRLHSIYAGYERDGHADLLCRILINSNPVVSCLGGHPAKFRREHLTAFRLAGA